jgi:hypothetical protein
MTELRRVLHHEAVRRERRYRLRRLVKRASLSALAGICRAIIALVRNGDHDRLGRTAGRLMRAIGPRLRGHRVARANLKAAFPEKSDQEIEHVILGVWDNLGRALAEFAFLDRLTDYDPRKPSNRWIIIDPADNERGFKIVDRGGPYLVFGATWQTGNCRRHFRQRSASRSPESTIPRAMARRMTCSSRFEAGEPN